MDTPERMPEPSIDKDRLLRIGHGASIHELDYLIEHFGITKILMDLDKIRALQNEPAEPVDERYGIYQPRSSATNGSYRFETLIAQKGYRYSLSESIGVIDGYRLEEIQQGYIVVTKRGFANNASPSGYETFLLSAYMNTSSPNLILTKRSKENRAGYQVTPTDTRTLNEFLTRLSLFFDIDS